MRAHGVDAPLVVAGPRWALLIILGRDPRMSVLAKRLVPGVIEPTMDRAIARVQR